MRKAELLCLYCLLTVCLLGVERVAAEERGDLFTAADEETVKRLLQPTHYEIREQLYFAKRYRFVVLNVQQLLQPVGHEFDITLFPDQVLHVRTRELNQQPDGRVGCWHGAILEPRTTYTYPEEDSAESHDELDELNNFALCWTLADLHVTSEIAASINAELKANRAAGRGFQPVDPANVPRLSQGSRWSAYQLSGDILPDWSGNSYAIRPLMEDPHYHILYEEDPDKTLGIKDAYQRSINYEAFRKELLDEQRVQGSLPSQ